ncbi:hypothetical protein HNP82_002256 [Catenibacillus scindens]|uniref:DUF554 domain-containing protein n=1 Tax=Catenibacillus scindens TaxID=673271 RepID=A0A7W8M609_9FIRM|nr:DUF554 domain-containing protein [Catenibacillus scindens]MBB5265117.1 hypothetical protein [Catenibacillus scindens]
MIGTIVNTLAITAGSLFGGLLNKGIPKKYENAMLTACGLAAFGVGINAIASNMPDSQYPVLFIVSLVLGSLAGTWLRLDDRLNGFIDRHSNGKLGQGIVTGVLIYCIGSLSIVGPVMAALNQDHTFLFTNASLDLVTSTVLASAYGIGMILCAAILFLWQGSIYVLTKYVWAGFFSDALVCELCIVGGFLIACTGLGILNIKKFKVLDMLPSLLVPVIFFILRIFF